MRLHRACYYDSVPLESAHDKPLSGMKFARREGANLFLAPLGTRPAKADDHLVELLRNRGHHVRSTMIWATSRIPLLTVSDSASVRQKLCAMSRAALCRLKGFGSNAL